MAAVSLFWDTNMAAVTSCENTLYQELVYQNEILKTMGAFHSTKTSCLNFRQFPVANGTAFSKKLPKQRTTSRGISKFSKIHSRKFSFHSTLLSEFLEFSTEWFAFRKFNSSPNFWKLFREISVPFTAFRKFWLNGKRP